VLEHERAAGATGGGALLARGVEEDRKSVV